MVSRVGKTLVIAEKPSVGRDIAAALPGAFKKEEGWLESDDTVVTWAVGHLVELVNPEEYDPKFKRWRMDDLPIVPEVFRLQPRDSKASKQLGVIRKLLKRADVERVINACDAGREGELIFAYTYENTGAGKPVQRLWLNSMTKTAITNAFGHLRPGEELKPLEEAARSRSEADWLVGMNATRAATIRLRRAFDGAVSLGRVQTPTLAMLVRRELEIQGFTSEPYWLVEATFAATGERVYAGRYLGGKRLPKQDAADAVVAACTGRPGEITKLEKTEERALPELLYDLTALQRHANTLYGFSARRTLGAAQKLYEDKKLLTYPRTSSRYLSSDLVEDIRPTAALVGAEPRVRTRRRVRRQPPRSAARPRRQRRQGDGPPRDHPDALRATSREAERRRAQGLRPRRPPLPRGLPPRGRVRAHARRDDRRRARLSHERPRAGRGRLEGRLRRGVARPERAGGRRGRRPVPAEARAGGRRRDAPRSTRSRR